MNDQAIQPSPEPVSDDAVTTVNAIQLATAAIGYPSSVLALGDYS